MCLPPDDGHMAEWGENMGGQVRIAGEQGPRAVLHHHEQPFAGGFITTGAMADSAKAYFAEGWNYPAQVRHQLAVAALPDERTMIVLEHCAVPIRTYLTEVKGLKLNVANDLFTGFTRRYHSGAGSVDRRGEAFGVHDLGGPWANVDDRLGVVGVYGGDSVHLVQTGERRASGYEHSLYYDELCCPCRVGLSAANAGDVVLDCGNVVLSGADHRETEAVAEGVERVETGEGLLRAVIVPGADGKRYLFVANFGETGVDTELPLPEGTRVVVEVAKREDGWTSGEGLHVSLKAGAAVLFALA
jgi:hypothetical protein